MFLFAAICCRPYHPGATTSRTDYDPFCTAANCPYVRLLPFFCERARRCRVQHVRSLGEFKVQGGQFKVQGGQFNVQGGQFKVQGGECKVQGGENKVQGGENKVQGGECKV
eukprot:605663-Prorocentrum_minimum.AAC.2